MIILWILMWTVLFFAVSASVCYAADYLYRADRSWTQHALYTCIGTLGIPYLLLVALYQAYALRLQDRSFTNSTGLN